MCIRDSLWTIYINELPSNDTDRLVQLIQMYDRGEKLEETKEKQIELLLTLFGWLLSSSNRWLRDYTSKAMIEILKEHFQLCEIILRKFQKVNDPYIIQRLYGIVFGACCKRTDGIFYDLESKTKGTHRHVLITQQLFFYRRAILYRIDPMMAANMIQLSALA